MNSDISSNPDIEEYMASLCTTNGDAAGSSISENSDSSSNEVTVIRELKINLDKHQCDLCCKGQFLVNRLLEFGGVLNDVHKHACDICDKGFKTKAGVTKHKKLHENGTLSEDLDVTNGTPGPSTPIIAAATQPMQCNICSKILKTKKNLERHRMTQHSNVIHKCELCDKNFSKFSKFTKHCKSHEQNHSKKLHSCSTCKKKFMFQQTLNRHVCTV